jgi:UDP-N-acetylglucosamine 2-epimerase (non-hydrolysing)
MPEEINRLVTDAVSDMLLTPSQDANENLLREGISPHKIRLVGNIMIDSLLRNVERARSSRILDQLGFDSDQLCLVTLHRPSNVDHKETLSGIMSALKLIARSLPVVFPVHPRTRSRLEEFGLVEPRDGSTGFVLLEPVTYLDFVRLYSKSQLVLTDSGGVQEETTALGIPCLTLRDNTERPITVTEGTNKVIGNNPERIEREALEAINREPSAGRIPELWDGKTAARIVNALLSVKPC